ncbi:transcription termination/antitermination protein NusG [Anaerolinea thermophila]|uniref:RfaH family transcriptional regulator n=1 Tax=Anaerolinea thermophila (strain DSM 14523 / JCM 11388 / NBRC 100420 / UNI-1) TaxID=926569 RepID=E8N6B2_ANATU|nr:transcription termination/antitermination NusG family protein [Anaerolinea thermophila]BAJ63976.1 putative RfaH family transcriptional regulator [Anaerolinea thermophila UNI-1]
MSKKWYAIQSKPNKEQALCEQFQSRGIEVFYPQIRVNPVNPRARKIRPYFPGYLFVHVDLDEVGLSVIRWIPFARGVVSFSNEPASVPDNLIEAIRRRVDEVNRAGGELLETLKPGEPVLIQEGPFAGYEAIFDVRLSGKERVRVLIQLLSQRYIPVEMQVGSLKPLKTKNKDKPHPL